MIMLYKIFWKQKSVWISGIATVFIVVSMALVRYHILGSEGNGPYYSENLYSTYFMYITTLAAIYTPLYLFWCSGTMEHFFDIKLIVRLSSRWNWILFYLRFAAFEAFMYSLVLNIPAYIMISCVGGNIFSNVLYFVFSFVLQGLMFALLSLLYFFVTLLSGKMEIGFFVGIVFSLWDSVLLFRGFGMDYNALLCGWGKVGINPETFQWSSTWWNILYFLCAIILILAACFITIWKKDFIKEEQTTQKR